MQKIMIVFLFSVALYSAEIICMQKEDFQAHEYERKDLIKAIDKKDDDRIEHILKINPSLANAYGPCLYHSGSHDHNDTKVAPIHYILCKVEKDKTYKDVSIKHMQLLLQAGANPNATDATYLMKRAPLHMDESLTIEHIQLLLRYGADVNQADNLHETPLMNYIEKRNVSFVRYLLEHADVAINQRGYNAKTALHYAAYEKSTVMIDLFLSYGADHTLRDSLFGQTPLKRAWDSLYKGYLRWHFRVPSKHINWFSFYLLIAQDAYLLKKFIAKEHSGKYSRNLFIAEQKLQCAIGTIDIEKLCDKQLVDLIYSIAGKSMVREELITAIDGYNFKAVEVLIAENPYVVNAYGTCPLYGDKITPLLHISRIPVNSADHTLLLDKLVNILVKAGANVSAVAYDDRESNMSAVD